MIVMHHLRSNIDSFCRSLSIYAESLDESGGEREVEEVYVEISTFSQPVEHD